MIEVLHKPQYFELSLPIIPGFVSVHIDVVLADTLGQLE